MRHYDLDYVLHHSKAVLRSRAFSVVARSYRNHYRTSSLMSFRTTLKRNLSCLTSIVSLLVSLAFDLASQLDYDFDYDFTSIDQQLLFSRIMITAPQV